MTKPLVTFLLLTLVQGCGGDSEAGASAGGGGSGAQASGGNGGGGTGGSGAGVSFSTQIGPIDVAPGYENTQCVVRRLGNPSAFRVGRIDNAISSASHHLIVYRSSDTDEQLEPFDCSPFTETLDPSKGSPIMVTQKHDDFLQLPQGVGYTFEANQMIRLELHYINTKLAPETVTATTKFTAVPESEYEHEADFLFIGDIDISIPVGATVTVGPTYFPLPAEFAAVNFFALTGHTHQFGTNVSVATTPSASGPDTPVYDVPGWQWSEPATVQHDPAFQLPSGGGFRFQCDYKNTGTKAVGFGESANAEMCFFWAYYYPAKGPRVCFQTDQTGPSLTACCPGSPLCSFL